MKPGFISVPFKIKGDSGGLTHAEGIAKFSAAGIVLEFETKFLGLVNTGFKDVRIPKNEIMDIKLISGFFNTKFESFFHNRLVIRLNSYQLMSEIPNKSGKIVMKIQRQDRGRAEAAVAALQSQPQLDEAGEETLPPAGTRVLFGDEADTKELE
jgi:hypothetical protein